MPEGAARARRFWRAPPDALTNAVLAFPLFAIHQVGILLGVRGNAADVVTDLLMVAAQRSVLQYLGLLVVMCLAYALAVAVLRRKGRFRAGAFLPVLLESTVLALAMGSVILTLMRYLDFLPGLSTLGPGPILVISAGAGFHEELIFRVVLMGGLAFALRTWTGRGRAWLAALAISAVLFSLGPPRRARRRAAHGRRVRLPHAGRRVLRARLLVPGLRGRGVDPRPLRRVRALAELSAARSGQGRTCTLTAPDDLSPARRNASPMSSMGSWWVAMRASSSRSSSSSFTAVAKSASSLVGCA